MSQAHAIHETIQAAKDAALSEVEERRAVISSLVAGLADGIRVLRHRDGVNISDDMCQERARNLAHWLLGDFDIKRAL